MVRGNYGEHSRDVVKKEQAKELQKEIDFETKFIEVLEKIVPNEDQCESDK